MINGSPQLCHWKTISSPSAQFKKKKLCFLYTASIVHCMAQIETGYSVPVIRKVTLEKQTVYYRNVQLFIVIRRTNVQ